MIYICPKITLNIDANNSRNNTRKLFVKFLSGISKSRCPRISMMAIWNKLDHDSLISVGHLRCGKLKMQCSFLTALVSQSISIKRGGHLYTISNPIGIKYFRGNRTTIIQIKLNVKLIPLHHTVNSQPNMLLIYPAFSRYGDGNL